VSITVTAPYSFRLSGSIFFGIDLLPAILHEARSRRLDFHF
jgi:hypothetical protein